MDRTDQTHKQPDDSRGDQDEIVGYGAAMIPARGGAGPLHAASSARSSLQGGDLPGCRSSQRIIIIRSQPSRPTSDPDVMRYPRWPPPAASAQLGRQARLQRPRGRSPSGHDRIPRLQVRFAT